MQAENIYIFLYEIAERFQESYCIPPIKYAKIGLSDARVPPSPGHLTFNLI